jgi:hypothetical protein
MNPKRDEFRCIMWREGKDLLPAKLRDHAHVYVTKILHAGAIEYVQVDLYKKDHTQHIALLEKCRWQDFPNEDVLAKVALVIG